VKSYNNAREVKEIQTANEAGWKEYLEMGKDKSEF
jgi:hypothetical protein